MRGFPKSLHTKEDYLYIKNNFEPEQWKPEFQKLLDTRMDWFFVKNLDSQEEGLNDNTHKVIEDKSVELDKEGKPFEKVTYTQFELKENPQCKLNLIGFTVDEVLEILNS